MQEPRQRKVETSFIGHSSSNRSVCKGTTCEPKLHPSLVRMCILQEADLLYGNIHTLHYITVFGCETLLRVMEGRGAGRWWLRIGRWGVYSSYLQQSLSFSRNVAILCIEEPSFQVRAAANFCRGRQHKHILEYVKTL